MIDILSQLERWQAQGEEIALATLVQVERSAPRLPGARLALTRSGRMAGSVSGGCVESDVFARALGVLERGAPELAHYGISDELGLEVGLSCGGAIDVWIEPFAADDAWRALRDALQGERAAALAVALAPAPLAGRRLLRTPDGACVGAIDPALDARIEEALAALPPAGGTRMLTLEVPGGPARVFAEAIPAPQRLYLVGATHAAAALCRLASALGFRVTVIDPRSPFATPERFPDAERVVRAWPDEVLASAGLDAGSYLVTLSHDPKFDIPALARALRSPAGYVGALGSRGTQERRRAALREAGFDERDLARIRGPIGLDLGARTPEEIALAILAEMVAVRHGREGGPLRGRRAPIHDR